MAFFTSGGLISSNINASNKSIDGSLKVSQNKVAFNTRFDDFLQTRIWSINAIGSTINYSTAINNLVLSSGTSIGNIEIYNRRSFSIIACQSFQYKTSLKFGDIGESGNIRVFGFGDYSNGFFFRLNGTNLEFVIRVGGSDILTSLSSAWSVPFAVDTNEHIYQIQFNSAGIKECYLYIDNVFRKLIQIPSQGMFDSINDLKLLFKNENLSSVSSNHDLHVSGVSLDYDFLCTHDNRVDFSVSVNAPINISGGTNTSIICLINKALNESVINRRRLFVKRINMGCESKGWCTIIKNATITGGTKILPETIINPTATPTVSLDAANATGSGYSDGNTVDYKIGVIGSIGRTAGSTASSSQAVGTPKKIVKVSWTKSQFGLGYELFRRLNGLGNYERIAILPIDTIEFYDNAYITNPAIVPAVSNTARNESFAEAYQTPTISGGQRIYTFRVEKASSELNLDIELLPSDNLTVFYDPDQNNDTVGASILWEEEII